MATFKSWITETLAPIWLRGVWGVKFLGVIGEAADRMADKAKESVKASFPELCQDDALSYNGKARNIERYTFDTHTTYRNRIKEPWTVWEFAGSTTALTNRLNEQGYSDVTVKGWYEIQPHVPSQWQNWYSAFFVWIDPPHNITNDGLWDDPGTWDEVVPATIAGGPSAVGAWDCNMTVNEVNELRASIRKWKEGHEVCADISILTSGERWEDVAPFDSGTWDSADEIHLPGY